MFCTAHPVRRSKACCNEKCWMPTLVLPHTTSNDGVRSEVTISGLCLPNAGSRHMARRRLSCMRVRTTPMVQYSVVQCTHTNRARRAHPTCRRFRSLASPPRRRLSGAVPAKTTGAATPMTGSLCPCASPCAEGCGRNRQVSIDLHYLYDVIASGTWRPGVAWCAVASKRRFA